MKQFSVPSNLVGVTPLTVEPDTDPKLPALIFTAEDIGAVSICLLPDQVAALRDYLTAWLSKTASVQDGAAVLRRRRDAFRQECQHRRPGLEL